MISSLAAWGLLAFVVLATGSVLAASIVGRYRATRAQSALTKEILKSALEAGGWKHVCVSSVRIPKVDRCGDGKASTTDRVFVQLELQPGMLAPDGSVAPRFLNVVVKVVLLPSFMRIGSIPALVSVAAWSAWLLRPLGLDRLVYFFLNSYNYYFPHAPDAMYENEARVYRHLRRDLPPEMIAPTVYGTIVDASTSTYLIMMEDLSLSGAQFPSVLSPLATEHVAGLLRSLAAMHAKFWNSERFSENGDLNWLPTPRRGGMHFVFSTIGHGLIRDHVSCHKFERDLLAPLQLTVDQLWEGCERASAALCEPPVTLCHGDAHVQNTFQTEDGQLGLLDWQLTLVCSWARDVSYIIGTGLTPHQRRNNERMLLATYLQELRTQLPSRAEAPDPDTAWRQYSMAMAWGLVIGWLICPPNNYGEEVTSENIRKLVAACKDLGTFDMLLGDKNASVAGVGSGCLEKPKNA